MNHCAFIRVSCWYKSVAVMGICEIKQLLDVLFVVFLIIITIINAD